MKYRTPVILLLGRLPRQRHPSRGGSPTSTSLPDLSDAFAFATDRGRRAFLPYGRDAETLARPWAMPGTPGLEHRVGGLEKADGTGNISYDPDNHELMVRTGRRRWAGSPCLTDPLSVDDPRQARAARARLGRHLRADRRGGAPGAPRPGHKVAQAHLRYLNPFPPNLGESCGATRRCWSRR